MLSNFLEKNSSSGIKTEAKTKKNVEAIVENNPKIGKNF